MPWKECDQMSEKLKFMSRYLDGERMTDLCKEFGISRKTGYKIVARYKEEGTDGFKPKSRRPARNPNQTPKGMVKLILKMRKRYPTWGPKKLRLLIIDENPGARVPVPSTIGLILKDNGLTETRKRKRRACPTPTPLKPSEAPNDIWSIDFKGHFRLKNKLYCYPLTVSDHFSRYLLCCESMESIKTGAVIDTMDTLFREYGLPDAIRSDNGAPFASCGLLGLTRFGVWLLRHNIRLQRIQPGHPEQNGRHERIHLTLKQETLRPPANNFLQQQERFDEFTHRYNHIRPHEALDMRPPAEVYKPSQRPYNPTLPPLEYPLHDRTCRIYQEGCIRMGDYDMRIYISQALAYENIGLRQLDEHTWIANFMDYEIGYIDTESKQFLPAKTANTLVTAPLTSTKVSPMSSD